MASNDCRAGVHLLAGTKRSSVRTCIGLGESGAFRNGIKT